MTSDRATNTPAARFRLLGAVKAQRGGEVEECEELFRTLGINQAQQTHYDRASSLHLCLGRIGSISSFTVYSLMAAGTQTARGGFMAPAAPLRLGEMSSLDCTSDTRTLSGLLSEQTPRRGNWSARTRPREAGANRCVRRATPRPVVCFICVISGH